MAERVLYTMSIPGFVRAIEAPTADEAVRRFTRAYRRQFQLDGTIRFTANVDGAFRDRQVACAVVNNPKAVEPDVHAWSWV